MRVTRSTSTARRSLGAEWPLPVALIILIVGWIFKSPLSADAVPNTAIAGAFVAFFAGALLAAIAAARHAEHLAVIFGEPYGTLILTISAISLEIATIATVMLHGQNNPLIGRDTMFSVLMIVMNGVIGAGLLIGGLKHHEQTYNLRGANAFLSLLIPLAALALIWPDFTVTTSAGTLSFAQTIFLIVMSLLLYAAFLIVQTRVYSNYFVAQGEEAIHVVDEAHHSNRGWPYHAVFLAIYLVTVVLLAKLFALPLDVGIEQLGMPAAAGALAVALLVLAPEAISAIQAAARNQMQRAMNIGLGTALSTISLTVPAVLLIGLTTNHVVVLGLNGADGTLLVLTFAVSTLTFTSGRTNVLQGMVHLLLFLAYIVLIFSP
ncbi:MAG: calcium:proton antiporter [Rhodanobacteraceae bacterium]